MESDSDDPVADGADRHCAGGHDERRRVEPFSRRATSAARRGLPRWPPRSTTSRWPVPLPPEPLEDCLRRGGSRARVHDSLPWRPSASILGGVAALAVVSSSASGRSDRSKRIDATASPEPEQTSRIEPLELVALGHDRDGDRLTVRGVVRNPASGMALDRITAVVLVYKVDGGFVGSGRATVDSTMLGPGGETAFTVTVPAAGQIGRYPRELPYLNRVVPHVDRRDRSGN